MTTEQTRRTRQALKETFVILAKFTDKGTFDKYQEEEKQNRIGGYVAHAKNLIAMLNGDGVELAAV